MRLFRLVLVLLAVALPAAAKDGDSRYAGLDGFLVHYKAWGKADAPAVILIHGFTLDQSFWTPQIRTLAGRYRVIAMDSPGHGDSAKPADVAYTMELYARAVEAVAADAGVTRAALIGHSMGLPVIQTVLRRGRLAVTKAVFIDGAIWPTDPAAVAEHDKTWVPFMDSLRGPDHRVAMQQFFQGFMPRLPPDWRKAVEANLRAYDHHMAVSTLEHFGAPDVWAPARFELPVLALYAEMSSPGVKEWLAAHYPRARLVVWADVDHFPQLEQPRRVNEAILKFLRK